MRRLIFEDKSTRDKTKVQASVIANVNERRATRAIDVKQAEYLRELMIAKEFEE